MNLIKKLLIILIAVALPLSAITLDEVLAKKDAKSLYEYVKKIKVYYDANDMPMDSEQNDLVIIEDDYNVQIVYEYIGENWNERTDPVLAKILNANEKLGFSHLFNFKLDDQEFQEFTSDKQNVFVEILTSDLEQNKITSNINRLVLEKKIDLKNIINIQIQPLDKKSAKIFIIYKY